MVIAMNLFMFVEDLQLKYKVLRIERILYLLWKITFQS